VILTGRLVTATDLERWGVVNALASREGLADETLRYARAVAAHSTDGLMIGRQAKKLFWDMMGISQWNDFVNIGHPLFTNLVWREDEANLLKERAHSSSSSEALRRVYQRWRTWALSEPATLGAVEDGVARLEAAEARLASASWWPGTPWRWTPGTSTPWWRCSWTTWTPG